MVIFFDTLCAFTVELVQGAPGSLHHITTMFETLLSKTLAADT